MENFNSSSNTPVLKVEVDSDGKKDNGYLGHLNGSTLESIDQLISKNENETTFPGLPTIPERPNSPDVEVVEVELETETESGGRIFKKFGGLCLALMASFLFSSAMLIVKYLKDLDFHGFACTYYRFQGTFVTAIPILLISLYVPPFSKREGKDTFGEIWPWSWNDWTKFKNFLWLIVRGILGSTTLLFRFFALKYLTLADVSTISYGYPVLVAVLAHFILSEKIGICTTLIAVIALVGVFIISRPPLLTGDTNFNMDTLIGTGLSIGSLFFNSFSLILTRKFRKVHFAVMALIIGAVGSIVALSVSLIFGVFNYPKNYTELSYVLSLIAVSVVAQILIILAYKFEKAGPVSLMRTCDPLFAFLLQFIFLGIVPDIYSTLGGLLIICAVATIGFIKWIASLEEHSKIYLRLKFLLK